MKNKRNIILQILIKLNIARQTKPQAAFDQTSASTTASSASTVSSQHSFFSSWSPGFFVVFFLSRFFFYSEKCNNSKHTNWFFSLWKAEDSVFVFSRLFLAHEGSKPAASGRRGDERKGGRGFTETPPRETSSSDFLFFSCSQCSTRRADQKRQAGVKGSKVTVLNSKGFHVKQHPIMTVPAPRCRPSSCCSSPYCFPGFSFSVQSFSLFKSWTSCGWK